MANTSQLYQMAITLHREGQFKRAETYYREVLASQPQNADAKHLLGVLCYQTSQHNEALKLIAAAISINPSNADYLNNHGLVLRALGRLDEALNSYQLALKLTPRDPDLQNNLGNVYQALERYEEAAGCYRRVLLANPKDIEVRDALCHALQILGNQSHTAGRYTQSEACFQEAVRFNPLVAALHYNLGNAQRELGKPAEAAASYQRALKLAPNDADIHNNLGNVLRELGMLGEAISSYQSALKLNPQLFHAKAHLVHQKQHVCDWKNLDQDIQEIRRWVVEYPEAQISPFAFLSMPGTTAAEQLNCAKNWVKNRYSLLMDEGRQLAYQYSSRPKERLRIGYLSNDFRLHPLAFLVSELITLHDRQKFTIHGYSYGPDDKSPQRKNLEKAFDHFVDIRSLSSKEAAKRIHDDQIDILVDLTGFTQNSRTNILALRPVPVQVSWLGFPGTMAAPFIDYLLSDSFITPPEQAGFYTEKLALLPDCYQPNDSKRPVAEVPGREQCGLPEDAFVFCCFNQTFKILPDIFDVWMRLLKALPNSVIWLLECNSLAKENLLQEAAIRGVEAKRLIFAPRLSIAEHMARHALADLFLDTLPYNAHTTSSDALWMGLPVLTCAGETFAGRVAASLLQAANLPELITGSLQDYERLALALATDKQRLTAIKAKLIRDRQSLPLFDTERFARNLEQAYQRMWEIHAADHPAQSFSVRG